MGVKLGWEAVSWVKVECLSHCSQLQPSAAMVCNALPPPPFDA